MIRVHIVEVLLLSKAFSSHYEMALTYKEYHIRHTDILKILYQAYIDKESSIVLYNSSRFMYLHHIMAD